MGNDLLFLRNSEGTNKEDTRIKRSCPHFQIVSTNGTGSITVPSWGSALKALAVVVCYHWNHGKGSKPFPSYSFTCIVKSKEEEDASSGVKLALEHHPCVNEILLTRQRGA